MPSLFESVHFLMEVKRRDTILSAICQHIESIFPIKATWEGKASFYFYVTRAGDECTA